MTRIPLPAGGNKSENLNDRLEMSTAEIGLSVRTTNCLEERGIFTVNDLLNCSPEDLLDISNFGEKTLEEVYSACLLYTSPSPRDRTRSRMPSSA